MTAQVLIAVASVVALFAACTGIRRLPAGLSIGAESQRKAVHVGVGIHAMLLRFCSIGRGF